MSRRVELVPMSTTATRTVGGMLDVRLPTAPARGRARFWETIARGARDDGGCRRPHRAMGTSPGRAKGADERERRWRRVALVSGSEQGDRQGGRPPAGGARLRGAAERRDAAKASAAAQELTESTGGARCGRLTLDVADPASIEAAAERGARRARAAGRAREQRGSRKRLRGVAARRRTSTPCRGRWTRTSSAPTD